MQVDELTSGGGATHSGIDFSTNETWNRLNADPLLLIKRNEVSKVKAVTSNPYLVAQLKERLRAERSAKANKKHKKKEKASKEKKHKRRRRSRCAAVPHCSDADNRLLRMARQQWDSTNSRLDIGTGLLSTVRRPWRCNHKRPCSAANASPLAT